MKDKLPTGWEWKLLEDIVLVIENGLADKQNEEGKGFPISRIETIQNQTFDPNRIQFVETTKDKFNKFRYKTGDIAFSHINSFEKLGKVAIFNNQVDALIHGANLIRLRFNDSISPKYAYYYFQSFSCRIQYENDIQRAINQASLNQSKIKKILFPIPHIIEQDKIVLVLEKTFNKTDQAITLIEQNIKKLKQLNESVLDEVFVNFGKDWKAHSLKCLTTKIGSGSTPTGGQSNYIEQGISLIRSLNVYDFGFRKNGLAFIDEKQAEKLSNVIIDENDVLLNITGASIARCCIVPKDILPARVNQHVSILRTKRDLVLPELLHYLLISPFYKNKLLSISSGGATREALSKSMLEDFFVSIPPIEKQKAIVQYINFSIEKNNQLIQYYQNKLEGLKQLKSSVLDSAFKGALRREKQTDVFLPKQVVAPKAKRNDKFRKIEILYASIYANKLDNIPQGGMAIAKDAYLIDRIGGVETGFQFAQHNWGAFDPEIKQLISLKKYFEVKKYPNSSATYYDLADDEQLLNIIPEYIKEPIISTIQYLNDLIFSKYNAKERPIKKELLATVLKCIEDVQSIDFATIRETMEKWKTPKQEYKNKAEKFSENDTKRILNIILQQGWHNKVIL